MFVGAVTTVALYVTNVLGKRTFAELSVIPRIKQNFDVVVCYYISNKLVVHFTQLRYDSYCEITTILT